MVMNHPPENDALLAQIKWDQAGLVTAIAQEYDSGTVLMVAWMDHAALAATLAEGRAVYYSRSRRRLWRKGEESGHIQKLREIRLDCDGDAVLMQVEQIGGIACHTGRHHCFYRRWRDGDWREVEAARKDPRDIYRRA